MGASVLARRVRLVLAICPSVPVIVEQADGQRQQYEANLAVTAVALDKTGTLTEGVPAVTDMLPIGGVGGSAPVSSQEALAVIAGIEARSQHPLAQAILHYAEERGIRPAEVTDFRSITGAGATARANQAAVYVGSPEFFERELRVSLGAAADHRPGHRARGRHRRGLCQPQARG